MVQCLVPGLEQLVRSAVLDPDTPILPGSSLRIVRIERSSNSPISGVVRSQRLDGRLCLQTQREIEISSQNDCDSCHDCGDDLMR